jgi:hypothetical protein
MGRKANIAMKCPQYGEMGPNPLLLRTGHQRRASAGVISARRRTTRYASSNPNDYGWAKALDSAPLSIGASVCKAHPA